MSNELNELRKKIFNDISPHSFGFMGAKSFAPENVDYILALIAESELKARKNEVGMINMGDNEYPAKRLAQLKEDK